MENEWYSLARRGWIVVYTVGFKYGGTYHMGRLGDSSTDLGNPQQSLNQSEPPLDIDIILIFKSINFKSKKGS